MADRNPAPDRRPRDADVNAPRHDHRLGRPSTIRLLWIVFVILLVLAVIPDFFVDHHAEFGIEGTFGFGAWFGLAGCALLVVGSKAIGWFLKRRDTYYGE